MPQLVKKRRSGWAVLAAGALVASLFAVGAAPAAALDEDSKPNSPAATSACVGDATEDRDFSDVSEMHTFRADINCLAYYGVTVGYGDGTFGPENDVTRGQMVLFMERAAAVAGADADKVVGDFAETGSDPVNRGDMALLIARLLVAATNNESPVNVKNNTDGTFTVDGVAAKDWDYFADSRRTQNRVHDSAASALYELGVAKGTGMGYFSPAAAVNRGQMAAFITRALAHTTARPSGVTIQSDGPGEVIISVRDANFQPVANATVDIFSARADQVDEAFRMNGTCNPSRVSGVGGDTTPCVIAGLDDITGLDGNLDPGAIAVNVKAGGTTVWAWTGESGDKIEDGGEGLAHVNLTDTSPVTADSAKVTTDIPMGVSRQAFGDTVTVTIQLVGADDADAARDSGGNSYTVTIRRATDLNIESDDLSAAPTAVDASGASSVETKVLNVDASGKATFEITASDPEPKDSNNPNGAPSATPVVPNTIDRVRVTYTVALTSGGRTLDDAISSTESGVQTIAFSDARSVVTAATLEPAVKFLTAPTSGSASNRVTVKVVDQYGRPVRGHLVQLSSNHSTNPPASGDLSEFPVARRTDSSGTVRIGYSYSGTGTVESLVANTSVSTTSGGTTTIALTAITGGAASFYWAVRATTAAHNTTLTTAAAVRVHDAATRTLVIGGDGSTAPLLVNYDSNDQFAVGASGEEALTTMAAFEETLAADKSNNDTVVVTSYDASDSSDVARFVLTVVADTP
jgi:hypothetical protein